MFVRLHFFKNVAMAGGLLQVVAFGGGRFSLDSRRETVRVGGMRDSNVPQA